MIKLSVYYPVTDGASFDHEYYRDRHVPLCLTTFNLASAEIDRGVDGPYVAAVHFKFESMVDMDAALAGEGTSAVIADGVNFTTIQPVMQISQLG